MILIILVTGHWCNMNNLDLSITKCKLITFLKKHSFLVEKYLLNCVELDRVNHTKDLGFYLDLSLSFN